MNRVVMAQTNVVDTATQARAGIGSACNLRAVHVHIVSSAFVASLASKKLSASDASHAYDNSAYSRWHRALRSAA